MIRAFVVLLAVIPFLLGCSHPISRAECRQVYGAWLNPPVPDELAKLKFAVEHGRQAEAREAASMLWAISPLPCVDPHGIYQRLMERIRHRPTAPSVFRIEEHLARELRRTVGPVPYWDNWARPTIAP